MRQSLTKLRQLGFALTTNSQMSAKRGEVVLDSAPEARLSSVGSQHLLLWRHVPLSLHLPACFVRSSRQAMIPSSSLDAVVDAAVLRAAG